MTHIIALLQAAPDLNARLTALETAAKNAQSAGDNAWMLVSAALVLMMTGPGLALFLRRPGPAQERALHHDAQLRHDGPDHRDLGVWSATAWCSAKALPFIGGLKYAFLNGVGTDPNADYAATIPHLTYMVYQLMFAIITPALISGGYAERMKFSAMALFTTLWAFIVYFPMAHMVWGKGGLLNAYLGGSIPTFDFAGGTVVHITSGVSALVCALVSG